MVVIYDFSVKFSLRHRLLVAALSLSISGIFFAPEAIAANPSCTPSSTTVGSLTVLEFDYSGGSYNTSGSNVGNTCDWTVPSYVTSINVVVVGGGASGGWGNQAGGGGGGEVIYSNSAISVSPSTTKAIVVGAGGASIAYGTNPVSLDVTVNVDYNPVTYGYTLSKINIANIPKPCVGDFMQINIQLADPFPSGIPHTESATAGAHFNCLMATPLSLRDNFDSGTATYGKYSFLAGNTGECKTDAFVNGTHSGFVDRSNNPTDGVPWDLSVIYATDLKQISIVVNS